MSDEPKLDRFHHADYYDYDLPKELIAQNPLANRLDARLLTVNRAQEKIDHQHIRDLDQLLNPGDCLVLNNTKVVPGGKACFWRRTQAGTGESFARPEARRNLEKQLPCRIGTELNESNWNSSRDSKMALGSFAPTPTPPPRTRSS